MDKINKISFIIPVKNRDIKRIKNCVNSIKSKYTGEIIIVDYGSKKPIKNISGVKIIRYNKNKIWNKAHAINLGIRDAKFDYIGTVDCDMIIHPEFIEHVNMYLYENSFIYNLNVNRIEIKNISDDFKKMIKLSNYWFEEKSRKNINHSANGGIQIYPKKWILNIGGIDESLIYWGAIDNDTFERAVMCGLNMININIPILHQEHMFKKEENLPAKERDKAFMIRIRKSEYLNKMFSQNKYFRNAGKWGMSIPNQNRFIRISKEQQETERLINRKSEEYNMEFIRAVKEGKKSFIFEGKEVEMFK